MGSMDLGELVALDYDFVPETWHSFLFRAYRDGVSGVIPSTDALFWNIRI